jgi:hypothetical protein
VPGHDTLLQLGDDSFCDHGIFLHRAHIL